MSRFWLALLLGLLLLPQPAAAESPGVPPREHGSHFAAQTPEYPHNVARSGGSLELLQQLETRRGKTSRLPLPDPFPARPGFAVARLRTLRGALGQPGVEVCAPLCQRLLYYATAPPARR